MLFKAYAIYNKMLKVETISEITRDTLIWSVFRFSRRVFMINDNKEKKKSTTATIKEITIICSSHTVRLDTSKSRSKKVVCSGRAISVIRKKVPNKSQTTKLDTRIQ